MAVIGDPSKLQFTAEASLIARFEQTRTEMAMYFDRCSDDDIAEAIRGMLDEPHASSQKM